MAIKQPSPGQDLLRLARAEGVSTQALETCTQNGELFACRDPRTLWTEDEVFVPSPEAKKESVRVGDTLCLVYRPARRKLHLVLRDASGVPIDCDYTLQTFEYDGTEDGRLPGPLYGYAYRGVVDEDLPAAVTQLELVINDDTEHPFLLHMGRLEPVSTLRGIKARLRNLGLYSGELDDAFDACVIEGLRAFQLTRSLPATGQPDIATCQALVAAHGC